MLDNKSSFSHGAFSAQNEFLQIKLFSLIIITYAERRMFEYCFIYSQILNLVPLFSNIKSMHLLCEFLMQTWRKQIIFFNQFNLWHTDIDECATETSECGANSYCNNTEGSFTCTCNTGYTGVPTDGCVGGCIKKIYIYIYFVKNVYCDFLVYQFNKQKHIQYF